MNYSDNMQSPCLAIRKKSKFYTQTNSTSLLTPSLRPRKSKPTLTQYALVPLTRQKTSLTLPKLTKIQNKSGRTNSNDYQSSVTNSLTNTPTISSHQVNEQVHLNLNELFMLQFTSSGQESPDKLKLNQDSLISYQSNQYHIYGVCDGHGPFGHHVSQFLSEQLPKNLQLCMTRNEYMLQYNTRFHKTVIKSAFQKTAADLSQTQIQIQKSGSTCNLVMLVQQNVINTIHFDLHEDFEKETVLYCANVGDSRAILVSANNRNGYTTTQLSFDHKPDIPEERQRIIQKGGCIDYYINEFGDRIGPPRVWLAEKAGLGLAMSRSFGDELGQTVGINAEPSIIEYKIKDNDLCVVIASDGLWDWLTNKDVANIIVDNPRKNVAELLVRIAKERWNENQLLSDDITCQVIYLN